MDDIQTIQEVNSMEKKQRVCGRRYKATIIEKIGFKFNVIMVKLCKTVWMRMIVIHSRTIWKSAMDS